VNKTNSKETNCELKTISFMTKEWINVIGVWQHVGAVGGEEVFKKLRCLKIPKKYSTSGIVYRIMGVKFKKFIDLREFNDKLVTSEYSSWSLDPKIAENFIRARWFHDFNDSREKIAVIFSFEPNNNDVFINLDKLWTNNELENEIEKYENEGIYMHEGLEFKNSQKEVILNKVELKNENIYAIWDLKKQNFKYL